MDNIDERLNELELRFMEQSRLLDDLSDEVSVCHRRIDALVRENNSMKEMMKSFEPESEVSPDE